MSTVVQNENDDYDIDVAIVFDRDVLGDKGPQAIRNMVADALRRKTQQFNAEPEVKTSCVRIKYADGYHINFAVYRRYYDDMNDNWIYEHAESEWSQRELKGLSEWFEEQNGNSDGKLRKVICLSKMFCESRDSWKNIPSGLIQTILCDEKLQDTYERIDELFYHTMEKVIDRIKFDTSVEAPVDNNGYLTPRKSDKKKMINWKNKLKSKMEDLDILFKNSCTKNDAIQVWYGFFNHNFWDSQEDESISSFAES